MQNKTKVDDGCRYCAVIGRRGLCSCLCTEAGKDTIDDSCGGGGLVISESNR